MVDEEKGFVVAGLPIMLVSQSADAARFMVHEENKSFGHWDCMIYTSSAKWDQNVMIEPSFLSCSAKRVQHEIS